MSTDNPTDAMLAQYSGDVYDKLLKDAEVDNRVGDHNAIIVKATKDKWPSGDDRYKIQVQLLTAQNAKADLTWSEPPSPEEIQRESANWEPNKKKGIANNITIARQAAQHYGKRVSDFVEGDQIRVKTAKTRREADGSGGFIRVISLLPPAGAEAAASSGRPGF